MELRRVMMRNAFSDHELAERRKAMVGLIAQVKEWEDMLLVSANTDALPPLPPKVCFALPCHGLQLSFSPACPTVSRRAERVCESLVPQQRPAVVERPTPCQ